MAKKEESASGMFNDDDFALFEDITDTLEADIENEIPDSDNNIEDQIINSQTDDTIEEEDEINDDAEDEVDTEVEDEVTADEDVENGTEETTSLFSPYIKFLSEEGILSNVDLENVDGTAEGLKKVMSNEINYHVEQYKSQMPAEVQRILDGYEKGVPFDEMLKVTSDTIRYDNVKEDAISSNSDLQKTLVMDYLNQTTRLNESTKSKMITQWEDGMELEDQAKIALTELKGIQSNKERQLIADQEVKKVEFQKRQDEQISNLNKHIDSVTEIVPGIKINQMIKDNVRKNLTTPVEYDNYGNPINKLGKYMRENPIEGEFTLNYIFEATNGFTNWGMFSKAGKSNAISEMEKAVAKLDNGANKGTISRNRGKAVGNSFKGIEDFLKS